MKEPTIGKEKAVATPGSNKQKATLLLAVIKDVCDDIEGITKDQLLGLTQPHSLKPLQPNYIMVWLYMHLKATLIICSGIIKTALPRKLINGTGFLMRLAGKALNPNGSVSKLSITMKIKLTNNSIIGNPADTEIQDYHYRSNV